MTARAICWVLWFWLALHLFWLEGWLVAVDGPVLDVTLVVSLWLALFARRSALAGCLVCAALARSVLMGGSTAVHVLVMGLPVALLFPLRTVVARHSSLWQCAMVAVMAVVVPRLGGLLGRLTDAGLLVPATPARVLWAMVVVPPLTWLLRSVPPLSVLQDRDA